MNSLFFIWKSKPTMKEFYRMSLLLACVGIGFPLLAFTSSDESCTYSELEDYQSTVATATIGDYVWNDYNRNGKQDSYERGIENVTIGLYAKGTDGVFNTDDDELIDYVATDEDGLYQFQNIATGEYIIKVLEFTMPDDYIFCPMYVGNDTSKDSDVDPETGASEAFVVSPEMNQMSFDVGMFSACAGFIPNMTIGYGQVLPAGGTPETLTILYPNIANPEMYEFQWMKKTAYTDWVGIPGANEMSYTPGPVYVDTYFVLCYRIATCPSSDFKESNVLLMEIGNCIAPIESNAIEYCVDEQVTFTSGNSSINLTYTWAAEGGVLTNTTGNSTSIVWFEPGDYYVDLTATSANGCEHTTRKLVHVRICNDFACCANGQFLTTLCYTAGTGSGSVLCSVQVPCNITDQLLATGQYTCGPCVGSPSCGTGFFLSSLDGSDPYEVNSQVDTNEQKAATATTEFSVDKDIKVFPNPAYSQINLTLDTKHLDRNTEKITVQLWDLQGRLHQELYVRNSADVEQLVFDLSQLTNGLYLFKIISGTEEPYVKKFVKIQE